MIPMETIIELLDTAGNGATIAILALMWRLDRRLLKIELHPNLATKKECPQC